MNPWASAGLFAALVVGLGLLIIGLSFLLGPRRVKPGKLDPYECGKPLLSSARERLSVHFYLVAIFFVLFDIETVFMIPWGVYYRQLSCAVPLAGGVCPAGQLSFFGLGEMLVFIVILLVGFVYVWRKGALQWD